MFSKLMSFIKTHKIALLLILGVMVIGYHDVIFNHANFFTEDDPSTVFQYSHGNAVGNGWRPDKGLGISFFMGDAGAFHPWSVFSLIEKILPFPLLVYNGSILILLFLAAVAQYLFMNMVHPAQDKKIHALLSTLVMLGPLQHEFYFQRHWITFAIGVPLFLWLLYQHFENPQRKDFLLGGGLLWAIMFLGSAAPFIQTLLIGGLFAVIYFFYKKPKIKPFLIRFFSFYSVVFVIVALLGAWIFYSVWIESRMETYVRDTKYFVEFGKLFDVKAFIFYGSQFFHCGLISSQTALPEALQSLKFSWTHPSVVFPIIFIFVVMFRPKTFWQSAVKSMYLILLTHDFLVNVSPLYLDVLNKYNPTYPLIKFQTAIHCLAITLISFCLSNPSQVDKPKSLGVTIQRWMALWLMLFYFGGFIATALIKANLPLVFGAITRGVQKIGMSTQHNFLLYVGKFFLGQGQAHIYWYTVVFWLSASVVCWMVWRQKRSEWMFISHQYVFVGLLVVNALLLSWSIYPVNQHKLIWDREELTDFKATVKATDRFYSFQSSSLDQSKEESTFQRRWPVDENGVVYWLAGYALVPGVNMSSTKSFTQKRVEEYLRATFDQKIVSMRQLNGGPEIVSPGLDIAAVKYYYSPRVFNRDEPSLVKRMEKPLWIYENTHAWPYYYLADEMVKGERFENGAVYKQGSAYVSKENVFKISAQTETSLVLKKFGYGEFLFAYSGKNDNFLVVADAWHPFWKATIDGQPTPVTKANFVFKGVRLPPGEHQIRLFFDTTAYKPGIYLSFGAWLVFICLFTNALFYQQTKINPGKN